MLSFRRRQWGRHVARSLSGLCSCEAPHMRMNYKLRKASRAKLRWSEDCCYGRWVYAVSGHQGRLRGGGMIWTGSERLCNIYIGGEHKRGHFQPWRERARCTLFWQPVCKSEAPQAPPAYRYQWGHNSINNLTFASWSPCPTSKSLQLTSFSGNPQLSHTGRGTNSFLDLPSTPWIGVSCV